MTRYLVKVSPDRNAYLEWSTIVGNAVSFGDREYYLTESDETRLARTDKHGTSSYDRFFGWDDTYLIVANNQPNTDGMLPRQRLPDLYDLFERDTEAPIPSEWLEPFED